jgi:aryl-alcohol dehydrogenase-like predicted oxidoreductase
MQQPLASRAGAAGLALGTVQWGLRYGVANRTGQPTRAEVAAMLDLARNAKVMVLDTARAYGTSEEVIGELVGDDPGWTVVTKLDPAASSPESARASVAASRRALGRQRLDGLLLHRAHHRTDLRGAIWDVLRRERDAGTVGQIGISAATPEEAWAGANDPDVDCLQVATSLLDQRLARTSFFQCAAGRGKMVFVRSVFLQGVAHLGPDDLPPHLDALREPLAAARQWAAKRGARPALAFLAFAASLPGARVLVGCESRAQLAENLHDWENARRLTTAVGPLSNMVPDLPVKTLNPALWPQA